MRVFVAGATGAIGRPLVERLVADGHHVVGSTRSNESADRLRKTGVVPVVVDLTDLDLVENVVVAAMPEVVINQLTSLPLPPDDPGFDQTLRDTSHLRGTVAPALARAAAAAGAKRLIAQSTAFESAADDPDLGRLEASTLETPGIDGVLLRFGYFYGPGTWFDIRPEDWEGDKDAPFVHVEDAAAVTALAVDTGAPGTYVISDDAKTSASARKQFDWKPAT